MPQATMNGQRNFTLNPADLRLSAQVKLTSNGEGAKTAKVTLVARSGDAIEHPYWGRIVHDFAGMTSKAKIPLDYAHYSYDSIGYLNRFETSTGDLVCSGVIVLDDEEDTAEVDIVNPSKLVAKMGAGVPYEASIEFGDDSVLEFVPEGYTTNVNGRDINGPVTVVRQWTLKAVAICKFGADSNTSAELQFSEANKSKEIQKGFVLRITKGRFMDNPSNEMQVQADKAATVETPGETATAVVEADVKAVENPQSEDKAEATVAVDAPKTEQPEATNAKKEVAAEAPAAPADEATPVTAFVAPKAEPVDTREEFKRFVSKFGAEKAANYFMEGLTFSDAAAKYADEVVKENEDLKKRLAAVDRGAPTPVKFSAAPEAEKPKGLQSVIKMPGATQFRK